MKRSAPPKRTTWLPRQRKKKRRSSARRCPEYLRLVRMLPCAFAGVAGPCTGRVHAHHAGARGLGQKADDFTAVSICAKHHREWHGGTGMFRGVEKAARKTLMSAALMRTRLRLAREIVLLAGVDRELVDAILPETDR